MKKWVTSSGESKESANFGGFATYPRALRLERKEAKYSQNEVRKLCEFYTLDV